MIIVNPNAQYLNPDDAISSYAFIERIGRTCYKSEKAQTSESAVEFVKMLIDRGHTAMLEHTHLILNTDINTAKHIMQALNTAYTSRTIQKEYSDVRAFFNITLSGPTISYISASIRTFLRLFEHEWLMSDNYIFALYKYIHSKFPEITPDIEGEDFTVNHIELMTRESFVSHVVANHEKDLAEHIIKKHLPHTILFTCDRGVTHELVRHRVASYAMESTRYCNYSKGKFDNQIAVVKPCFWNENSEQYKIWKSACETAEANYMTLIKNGCTAQEARSLLPHSVKADIVVTATEYEWQHILNLRYKGTTGAPHPQMQEVMSMAYPLLVKHSDGRLS